MRPSFRPHRWAIPSKACCEWYEWVERVLSKERNTIGLDIDRFAFNTAVAALMAFSNALTDYVRAGAEVETFNEAIRLMLLMLSPMAPHMAHELWEQTGGDGMLATKAWPAHDPELVVESTVTMVVQVNGKVRERIDVAADIDEEEAEKLALASERIQGWLDGKEVRKIITVPPKLVNIVVA